MWIYRCERCGTKLQSFVRAIICKAPKCRGQLTLERSELHYKPRDTDENLGTGKPGNRGSTDALTTHALEMAFSKLKDLSNGSVLKIDFSEVLRLKDHYGKTVTVEWGAHVIDDLVQERILCRVEYRAGVNIDTAHVPTVKGKEQEFSGPDKPHVGWDLSKKILLYQQDGNEKVLSKTTAVGHIFLDDVPAFRPGQKGDSDQRLERTSITTIDKRKRTPANRTK